MLTWDEVKQAVDQAMACNPEEFCMLVADYMPQNIIDELLEDHINTQLRETEGNITAVALTDNTANFMAGVQVGWFIAKRACHHAK